MQPELKFHDVHSNNIDLERNGRRAVKRNANLIEVIFSDRPISIDERVSLRLTVDGSSDWDRGLNFGVTNVNPSSMNSEFDFMSTQMMEMCCNSVEEKRLWMNEVSGEFLSVGDLVEFSVSESGNIIYSINGESGDIFIRDIEISRPLWIVIELGAESKAIEFESQQDAEEVGLPRRKNMPRPQWVLTRFAQLRSTRLAEISAALEANEHAPNVVQLNSSPSSAFDRTDSMTCSICMRPEMTMEVYDCCRMCVCEGCTMTIGGSEEGCPFCR